MLKKHSSKDKQRVIKDFEETLNNLIRTSSTEEINLKNEFEKSDNKTDFYKSSETIITLDQSNSQPIQKKQSIYRSKSFKNYEVVVTDTSENENPPSVSTRPILASQPSVETKRSIKTSFMQIFFPSISNFRLPFQRATINSLPFYLTIVLIEAGKTFKLKVKNYYTVFRVKSKILAKEQIPVEQQALFFNSKRLEASNMLYVYDIKSNSRVEVKLSESIQIRGRFGETEIIQSTYSSATIKQIRERFAIELPDKKILFELRHNDLKLDENKELFFYSETNGFEIEIVSPDAKRNPGFEHIDEFFRLTQNLTKCTCYQQRIQAISYLITTICTHERNEEKISQYCKFLTEIETTRGYHHINCFKLSPSPRGELSSISEHTSAEFSDSENSFTSAVKTENERIDYLKLDSIDEDYIKYLSECKEFENYNHLLQNKIGTTCTITSVALLYKYTRYTVRYIGLDETENSPDVERILDFTKLYFNKYFKKDILDRGGLDCLVLSANQVD